MLDEGLADCVKNIRPIEFEIATGERIKIFIENITIANPQVPASCITARTKRIFPSECRQVRKSLFSSDWMRCLAVWIMEIIEFLVEYGFDSVLEHTVEHVRCPLDGL